MPTSADLPEYLRIPERLTDPQRPRVHYQPPARWMNDPNGLIEWDGQYHLFYQYNPHGAFHGTIHWGHAVSRDLVHWQDLPVALAPTPGGPDAAGCWSGCAVDDGGRPTLVYTGVDPQAVCLATGSPDLVNWAKHPANPVIAGPPADLAPRMGGDFRDPFVWHEGGQWHLVIAGKLEGQGGIVLRYTSPDLVQWTYQGVFLSGDARQHAPVWQGNIWECPNFLPIDGQPILILSVPAPVSGLLNVIYYAGQWDGATFTPAPPLPLVYGYCFYAPQLMRLGAGRVVMFGWLTEDRPPEVAQAAGWQGAMTVPIELTWGSEGALHFDPVAELQAQRRAHWHFDAATLTPAALRAVRGDSLDLEVELELGPDAAWGLAFSHAGAGAEQTTLVVDAALGKLVVEPFGADHARQEAPLPLAAEGRVRLRVVLDRSVLEVYANASTCLISRLYPSQPAGQGFTLFGQRGPAVVRALDVWELASIW